MAPPTRHPRPFVLGTAQEALLESFGRAVRAGTLAHAYLLLGARGIGKRTLALELARLIVCPTAGAKDCACLGCNLSGADLRAGKHPEVHVVSAPEGKEIIPVDHVREALVKAVQLRSYSDGRQVFIVEEAHRLTEDGQNTLLKTLEEPGAGVHILLTTDAATTLLPTVRSRCHAVFVPPLSADAFAAATGLGTDNSQVRLAAGSFSRLAQQAGDTGPLAATAGVLAWLQDGTEALALVDALVPERSTTSLESQAAVLPRLDALGFVLRDALHLATGCSEAQIFQLEHAAAIGKVAERFGGFALARALSATHDAKEAVQSYVDPTLAALRLADVLLAVLPSGARS